MVVAPQPGIARRGPQPGLGGPRLAGAGTDEHLAHVRDAAVLEAELRLEPELDLLDLVQRTAIGPEEDQVGRDVIADLGGPPSFGTI